MTLPSLERVRAQHFELYRQLRALEQVLELRSESAATRTERTRVLLIGLRNAMQEHFALEEEGGYFAEALAAAPRLTRRAETLFRHHNELRRRARWLAELLRKADGAEPAWEDFRSELLVFLGDLRTHETEENELMRDAFLDDLAASD
jgi:hemerythrin-like domain-containing protein